MGTCLFDPCTPGGHNLGANSLNVFPHLNLSCLMHSWVRGGDPGLNCGSQGKCHAQE